MKKTPVFVLFAFLGLAGLSLQLAGRSLFAEKCPASHRYGDSSCDQDDDEGVEDSGANELS
jgi:hypothetical protein